MNAKEASALLGLHPNTIYKMIRNGEIEAEKKGKSFDIPQSEIDRLLSDKKISVDDSIMEHLHSLESLMQTKADKLNDMIQKVSAASLGKGGEFNGWEFDPFDAMTEHARLETFAKQISYMRKYIQKGEKLYQTVDKNGGVTTHSKVVNDDDKDES